MKKILFSITFLTFLFSQQAEITNIQIAQRTDGSKLVDIYFDITEDAVFDIFDISLEITFDQGENFTNLNQYLGDTSNLNFGTNYHITWNLGQEYPDIELNNVQIKINASGSLEQEIPFEMVTIPAGPFIFGWDQEIMDLNYDFQMMKNEVSYSQFAEFLISAYSEGYITLHNNPNNNNSCYKEFDYNNFGIPSDTPVPIYEFLNIDGQNPQNKISFSTEFETFYVLEGWGNHPVSEINFAGALAFSNYYGLRLPTAYEWEKAARGNTENNTTYPWEDYETEAAFCQNFWDSGDLFELGYDWGNETTTPVGFFNGQNYQGFQTIDCSQPYGIYDLWGNLAEWTSSFCNSAEEVVEFNTYNLCGKGSTHLSTPRPSYTAFTWTWSYSSLSTGFRCARTINN